MNDSLDVLCIGTDVKKKRQLYNFVNSNEDAWHTRKSMDIVIVSIN